MIRLRLILSIVAGTVAVGTIPLASQEDRPRMAKSGVTILFPQDSSLSSWPTIHAVVQYAPASGQWLQVYLNDTIVMLQTDVPSASSSRAAHVELALLAGVNTISAQLWDSSGLIDQDSVQVSFWHEMLAGGVKPTGMPALQFHTDQDEQVCRECHALNSTTVITDEDEYNKFCRGCHQNLLTRKYLHDAEVTGNCYTCHPPEDGPVRFPLPDPVVSNCYACHENNTQGKKVHGPTSTGRCTICHDPHAADNPSLLKKPTWNLCVTCHAEKTDGVHVVAGFVFGDSHPTKGWEDPTQPGKDFSCASCHNPHSTDTPNLWKYDAQRRGQLCVVCHPK